MSSSGRPRPGRPPVPDQQIVDGARRALVADPRAPMAEIARSAGVGMSALYARFAGREALLRYFADEANRRYQSALDEAADRLAAGWSCRRVLQEFMVEIAMADVHRVGLATFGTFHRTRADLAHSVRLRDAGRDLVSRCREAGVLRPGVTWSDLYKVQEMIASVEGADDTATRALRRRMLDVALTGLTRGRQPLPGEPPTGADLSENRPVSARR